MATKTGSRDRTIIELATEVWRRDSIQNKKCRPKKSPDKKMSPPSLGLNFRTSRRTILPIQGAISKTVISSRYMPRIEAGASDHLMKMTEKEIATIPTISAGTGDRVKRPIFIEQVSYIFLSTPTLCGRMRLHP